MIEFNRCPICDSDNIEVITDDGDKFTSEKANLCLYCGVGFLSPSMDHDELREYYFSDTFSMDFRGNAEPDEAKREGNRDRAERRWFLLKDRLPDSGSLLEIGCSSGEFLDVAAQRYDVVGIDASSGYVKSINHAGFIGVFPDILYEKDLGKFDIIATFHTLEHVRDPRRFLNAVHTQLNDGGTFILEYPDLSRASYRLSLRSSYFQKSHLFDFSSFNISNLLGECGFEITEGFFGEQFPEDKNALLVCKKIEPVDDVSYDRNDLATQLYSRLRRKVKNVNMAFNKPLQIVHVFSSDINMGDGAIGAGIRSVMTAMTEQNNRYYNLNIVDFAAERKFYTADDLMAYKPDLILVGGGGTIDGHETRQETGLAFSTPISELEKLKVPIAFVGLGHNVFRSQPAYHMDKLDEYVQFCAANDIPFSVRRDGSWERLNTMLSQVAMEHIQKIPDPGFFIQAERNVPSTCFVPDAPKKIVVQLALDAYAHRFNKGKADSEPIVKKFTQEISKVCQEIIHKHNASICFATHTTDDLWGTLSVLTSDFDKRVVRLRTHVTGIHHPVYAGRFFTTYREADLVIGMRGHSVICATGLATPVVALSTHDKVKGYMAEVGGLAWTLDKEWDDFSAENIYTLADELLRNPAEQLTRVTISTQNWLVEFVDFLHQCLVGVV